MLNLLKPRRTAADLAAAHTTLAGEIAADEARIPALESTLDEALLSGAGDAEALRALSDAKADLASKRDRLAALERAQGVAEQREREDRAAAMRADGERMAAELAARVAKLDKLFAGAARELAEIQRAGDNVFDLNRQLEALGGKAVPSPWIGFVRQAVIPRAVGDGCDHWRGAGVRTALLLNT